MANGHVLGRLQGIQTILRGVHQAGGPMTNSTKGSERQAFIDQFLANVFPAPFRFGSGDATDATGNRSGQLDVVVEYPFMPSLPLVAPPTSRLYLAESLAAVVEVKSDVGGQWDDVLSTARQLEPLRREFGAQMIMGSPPLERIPLFAVGYTGWKQTSTLLSKLGEGAVDGVLVIDPGVFVSSQSFGSIQATGPWALWGLICCLHKAMGNLKSASTEPLRYAMP